MGKQSDGRAGNRVPWFFATPTRLFAWLFVSLLVPLAILVVVLSGQARRVMHDQAVIQNSATARLAAATARAHLDALSRFAESFATRRTLLRAVRDGDAEGVERNLRDLVERGGPIERVFVTDLAGVE
ncbi:MAG: hypothetical protein AAB368_02660, partial [bacterium]